MRDFFTKLLSDYEKIAHNQIGSLEPGLSADEVVASCKETIQVIKALRLGINRMLEEHIYPVLDDIENIPDDEEAELLAVAQKLSAYDAAHDPGLAYKIYTALLARARAKRDDERIIKYLYCCGITLFFFFNKQHEKILEFFEEGASYADRYDSFDDPEIRQYIHRCLGNLSMITYSISDPPGGPEKAMAIEEMNFSFWNSIIFSGKDLDFPWLNYFMSCFNHRHSYLTHKVHTDPDSETKEALGKILDNAITLNKLYQKNRESFSLYGGSRYDYALWEAQFLSGLISFDLLFENINERKAQFELDDFSADAMYVKIQLSTFLMFYAARMKKLSDRKCEVLDLLSKDVVKQFSLMPVSVSPVSVSRQLQAFATNLSEIFEPLEQLDFVLRMSIFRHIPTYAHSIVVGELAHVLTKYLIEKQPELFAGCMDFPSTDDIQSRAKEICRFAYTCGMCHDIGKVSYVCNPYMQARVLTDDEYEVIKQHTDDGVLLLSRDNASALSAGFIDVIRGHHKYYDNSGGYPEDFDIGKSRYRMIIDVVSVADAIDAATDTIGDTGVEAISLESVREELMAEAGRKYSAVVAGALNDSLVFAEVKRILDEERPNAYYTAYLHAWAGKG